MDSDNNSLVNSETESESDTPVVKTKAHSATMALRQQLKSLSDSSEDADESHTHPPQSLQPSPLPSSISVMRPPIVPTIPAKQTTPTALAAGARLVGARTSVVDTRQECSTSKSDSSSQDHRHFPHDAVHAASRLDRKQKHTTSYSSKSGTTTKTITSTSELNSTTTATPATSTITTTTSTATTPAARLPTPSLGFTRAVSTNPHITRFMSTLQKSGMDILYPQTVHDQVCNLVVS